VENLLANAQEAAPGGVNIQVSIDVPANGETCSIVVADDGPGMPAEVAGDVFQRPLNSTKPGGTGLGTALVKYIVDQHRGCLTWDSPSMNDHGTRVTLSLPRP
jgi:signal transduction histidine kinase